MTDDWLTDDVVAAVTAHMNGDHADDNVVICRVAGRVPDVEAARMIGMDHAGLDFEVTTPAGTKIVRVPFGEPVTERAQIRAEVARIYHECVEGPHH